MNEPEQDPKEALHVAPSDDSALQPDGLNETEKLQVKVTDIDGKIRSLRSVYEEAVTAARRHKRDPAEVPGAELLNLSAADHASDPKALDQLEAKVEQLEPQVRGAAGQAMLEDAGEAVQVGAGAATLGAGAAIGRALRKLGITGDGKHIGGEAYFAALDHGVHAQGEKRQEQGHTLPLPSN